MLLRKIIKFSVGLNLKRKTPLTQSFSASTFIQDENSGMKYWEHEVEKERGICYKNVHIIWIFSISVKEYSF